jgi:uncharacterized protein (TIGR03067 family)
MRHKLLYVIIFINLTAIQHEDSILPYYLKTLDCFVSKRACSDEPNDKQLWLADDTNNDSKKIQGTWGAVIFTLAGKEEVKVDKPCSPEDCIIKLLFDGEDMTILPFVHQETLKGTFKLDPTKTPKSIDVTFPPAEGKKKDQTLEGIYKFDGDTLEICFKSINGNGKRPNEFKAGTYVNLFTFKKLKK